MKCIVGLGNPGEKYATTRHNVAWILFDEMFNLQDWEFSKYSNAQILRAFWSDHEVGVMKPQTFMNESGQSVAYVLKHNEIAPQDFIAVYDDIDIPLGQIKVSFDKSDGGHNGVKSIINHLGSREFVRVRVGIADGNLSTRMPRNQYVLARFSDDELEQVKNIAPRLKQILQTIVRDGYQKAMNEFN